MTKIAICDDEKTICEELNKKLASYMENRKEEFEIQRFLNSNSLLETRCDFDLFFLDINMPGKDGLTLAKKIRENKNKGLIIFITALSERVYESFEVEAFDYILKPVSDERLENCLSRALKRLKENESKLIFIHTLNWSKTVKLDDIYYCEVINRKIYLHTKQGIVEYYSKLSDIEKQLDYRFVHCHRSYIVNLDYMREYNLGRIILENGENLPVSRLKHKEFMDYVMAYMKRNGK